jgi:hypothetical protein
MRLRTLIIVGGLIGLVIIGAAAWYLISPLFIDKTVDEVFPFEVPSTDPNSRASSSTVCRSTLCLRRQPLADLAFPPANLTWPGVDRKNGQRIFENLG